MKRILKNILNVIIKNKLLYFEKNFLIKYEDWPNPKSSHAFTI